MGKLVETIATVSNLLAALMFVVLAAFVATRWRQRLQRGLLLLALLASAAWAGLLALEAAWGGVPADVLIAADAIRDSAWLFFLARVLLETGRSTDVRILWWSALVLPIVVVATALGAPVFGFPEPLSTWGLVLLCLLGIVLIERIYRCAAHTHRRPIAHLAIALTGIFGYDVFMYSSSLFGGEVAASIWSARGLANAMVIPFLFTAVRDNRAWSVEAFVSRQAAFIGVALTGACLYLISVATIAVVVGRHGGDAGAVAAGILVFGATIFLLTMFLVDDFRRNAKVLVNKHFFRNRYDYREEWRRLTKALYHSGDSRSLAERSIAVATDIMDSRSAVMLVQSGGKDGPFQPVAAWHRQDSAMLSEDPGSSLVRFLESSQWIVDTRQYDDNPDMYEDLELPDWLRLSKHQQLVVPLLLDNRLTGMLVLEQQTPVSLTYEDTDLLKIVGRQVAGLMAQEQSLEKLAEARQFRAYSRLTAFIMHDLKNLAAQQSLVVKNAAEHKRNPDFVDDAFTTIAHSVERMKRLIAQLAERDRKEKRQRVNVIDILNAAVKRTRDRKPHPPQDVDSEPVLVLADRDRLFTIFLHILRNAQDACNADDEVRVDMSRVNGMVKIAVADTGGGMDDAFVRDRLFRPFDSTKGVDGMGIGAYQAREYVRELGGFLDVSSVPGEGTTMTINLPVADVSS